MRYEGKYHSFEDVIVRYAEQTSGLVEISLPDDIKEYGVLTETDWLMTEVISLPPDESTLADKLDLAMDGIELYWEFQEIVTEYDYFQPPHGSYFDSIKLMGHPQQLQRCILFEAVLKRLKLRWYNPDENRQELTSEMVEKANSEALQWRHLFSFTTDEFKRIGNFKEPFNEHMDGIFNVMIKQDDLDKMHFDDTESVYQFT